MDTWGAIRYWGISMNEVFLPRGAVVFLWCLSALPGGAWASTLLFDGGAPDGSSGSVLSFQWPDGTGPVIVADDFVLGDNAQVSGVQFWTYERSPGSGNTVDYYLFADSGWGQPAAAPLASGRVDNVLKTPDPQARFEDAPGYSYEFSFDGAVTLSGGSTYWLALGLPEGGERWWRATQDASGDEAYLGTFADGAVGRWFAAGGNQAFALFGQPVVPVPVPGSLSLLALGLLGLGLVRRVLGRIPEDPVSA